MNKKRFVMNNRFSWQSFISIGLLLSFIVMFFSGIILYLAPEGSLSRWLGWEVIALSKKQWEYQHTIFSYLFVLFTVFHIFKINWGLLISYFSADKLRMVYLREVLLAVLIVVFVFVGTLINLVPFESIIKAGNKLSDNYSRKVEMPNTPDSEKLTLGEFAEKGFSISSTQLQIALRSAGFKAISMDMKVIDFCKVNQLSPNEFYIKIQTVIKSKAQ